MRNYPIDKATISDTSYSDSLIGYSVAHCNHIRRFRGCFEARVSGFVTVLSSAGARGLTGAKVKVEPSEAP